MGIVREQESLQVLLGREICCITKQRGEYATISRGKMGDHGTEFLVRAQSRCDRDKGLKLSGDMVVATTDNKVWLVINFHKLLKEKLGPCSFSLHSKPSRCPDTFNIILITQLGSILDFAMFLPSWLLKILSSAPNIQRLGHRADQL